MDGPPDMEAIYSLNIYLKKAITCQSFATFDAIPLNLS